MRPPPDKIVGRNPSGFQVSGITEDGAQHRAVGRVAQKKEKDGGYPNTDRGAQAH